MVGDILTIALVERTLAVKSATQTSGREGEIGLSPPVTGPLGFLVGLMFFLGGVFGLLWATAYLLGRKIERERAAAYSAFDAQSPGEPR